MVCLRNINVDTLHKGDTEDYYYYYYYYYYYKNIIVSKAQQTLHFFTKRDKEICPITFYDSLYKTFIKVASKFLALLLCT